MKHDAIVKRRPTNLSLPEDLVSQARALGINVSKECTFSLAAAVRREADKRWQEEHRERIDAFSAWLDENGMPFEDLRVY